MAREINSHSDQINMQLAESAKMVADSLIWKEVRSAIVNSEANCLIRLHNYLIDAEHPDREEVITLCLKWHAYRAIRRLLLGMIEDYKALTVPQPFSEEAMEEAQRILGEYGE